MPARLFNLTFPLYVCFPYFAEMPFDIIVDDVLATGGTLEATNRVAGLAGYDVIDNVVLIDLKYVPRIDNFDLDVKSVVSYE